MPNVSETQERWVRFPRPTTTATTRLRKMFICAVAVDIADVCVLFKQEAGSCFVILFYFNLAPSFPRFSSRRAIPPRRTNFVSRGAEENCFHCHCPGGKFLHGRRTMAGHDKMTVEDGLRARTPEHSVLANWLSRLISVVLVTAAWGKFSHEKRKNIQMRFWCSSFNNDRHWRVNIFSTSIYLSDGSLQPIWPCSGWTRPTLVRCH